MGDCRRTGSRCLSERVRNFRYGCGSYLDTAVRENFWLASLRAFPRALFLALALALVLHRLAVRGDVAAQGDLHLWPQARHRPRADLRGFGHGPGPEVRAVPAAAPDRDLAIGLAVH